jgi:hypothetical protein
MKEGKPVARDKQPEEQPQKLELGKALICVFNGKMLQAIYRTRIVKIQLPEGQVVKITRWPWCGFA